MKTSTFNLSQFIASYLIAALIVFVAIPVVFGIGTQACSNQKNSVCNTIQNIHDSYIRGFFI